MRFIPAAAAQPTALTIPHEIANLRQREQMLLGQIDGYAKSVETTTQQCDEVLVMVEEYRRRAQGLRIALVFLFVGVGVALGQGIWLLIALFGPVMIAGVCLMLAYSIHADKKLQEARRLDENAISRADVVVGTEKDLKEVQMRRRFLEAEHTLQQQKKDQP